MGGLSEIPIPAVTFVTILERVEPSPIYEDAVTIPVDFNSLTVVTPRVVIPVALKLVTEAIPPITLIAVVAVETLIP